MGLLARATNMIKRYGVKGVYEKVVYRDAANSNRIAGEFQQFFDYCQNEGTPLNRADYLACRDSEKKTLNWIIPDIGKGSGGHLNIFRFATLLETRGFHSRIFCFNSRFTSDEEAQGFIHKHFPILDKEIEVFCDIRSMVFAHATIATQWTTAFPLQAFNNTLAKFYFIQDYEPYFYAHGAEYTFAELSYSLGFRALTAGGWLKTIMEKEYGLSADSFSFSYDKSVYFAHERADSRKRVFFYARPETQRRSFEIGLLVLTELAKRIPDLEVIFAGGDLSHFKINLPHYRILGIMSTHELAEVYSSCDICLVFSNTNLSLLPLEIMASGSVVASSNGSNNEWLLNNSNAILLNGNPKDMVDTLERFLGDSGGLDKLREAGREFALSTSWEHEGDSLAQAIIKGISEEDALLRQRFENNGNE
jgi:glycosyltransferase involved in cell wall biosynthesis